MKLIVLCLLAAFVGLAVSQECSWANTWGWWNRDGSGDEWEDHEISAWSMDGGNRWYDFWSRGCPSGDCNFQSRLEFATYNNGGVNIPSFPDNCLYSPRCYPYYDVNSAGPSQIVGNPPFEPENGIDSPDLDWTRQNCEQFKPAYVYYYRTQMTLESDGDYQMRLGISKAFTPTDSAWSDFCDRIISSPNSEWAPAARGAADHSSLVGQHYAKASGFYLFDSNDDDAALFFPTGFRNGCHMKAHAHRYPTAVYCNDASGWSFGSGLTIHVRFGCRRHSFVELTDSDFIFDEEECSTVYLAYDSLAADTFNNAPNGLSGDVFGGSECLSDTSRVKLSADMPNYRTPCSAGVRVPVLMSVLGALLFAVLRLF